MNPLLSPPNMLTIARIVLIPVFVLFFYLPTPWANKAATLVFVLAALTDLLDGFLARRMGLTSALGAFLDPVADKLMVAAALVLVVQDNPVFWLVLPALVIIGREITISALREWMAELGARTQVAVSAIGKIKTVVQMGSITLLIYRQPVHGIPVYTIGLVLLFIAVVLTLWSMLIYLRAAWPQLSASDQGKLLRKED